VKLKRFYARLCQEGQRRVSDERTLYCTRCEHGIIVKNELPQTCPHCGSTTWRSAKTPENPLTFNLNDQRFLKSIKIEPS
jgi:predicted RNA-binding Zn-ribbon protein involved in translation (DUF1610 family)